MPANLAAGWDIVVEFATNAWSIPQAHSLLQEHLGNQYVTSEWNKPLDSVSGAEGDANAALAAVNAWCNQWAPVMMLTGSGGLTASITGSRFESGCYWRGIWMWEWGGESRLIIRLEIVALVHSDLNTRARSLSENESQEGYMKEGFPEHTGRKRR